MSTTTVTATFKTTVPAYYLGRPRGLYEARYGRRGAVISLDAAATAPTGYGLAILELLRHRPCQPCHQGLTAPWTAATSTPERLAA